MIGNTGAKTSKACIANLGLDDNIAIHRPLACPLIIDINGSEAVLLCDSSARKPKERLYHLFQALIHSPVDSDISVMVISSADITESGEDLSFPLIAGWLLGYPSLYHLNSKNPTNAINGSTLVKYEMIFMNESSLDKSCKLMDIDHLMDFSIPKSILESSPEALQIVQRWTDSALYDINNALVTLKEKNTQYEFFLDIYVNRMIKDTPRSKTKTADPFQLLASVKTSEIRIDSVVL